MQPKKYQLKCKKGVYVRVRVQQRGVDVSVSVFDPSGDLVYRTNQWASPFGEELVELLTTISGTYRVVVQPLSIYENSHFSVLLQVMRPATFTERASIPRMKQIAELCWQANSLYEQGGRKSLQTASQLFREALFKVPASADDSWRASIMTGIGEILYDLGEHSLAEIFHRDAAGYWISARNLDGQGEAFNDLAVDKFQDGDLNSAEDLAQRSLNNWERVGNHRGIAIATSLLGRVHEFQSNYQQSLADYERARRENEKVKDPSWAGYIAHSFGMLLLKMGDYEAALSEYEIGLTLSKSLKDSSGKSHLLHHLGEVYIAQHRYGDASVVLNEALATESDSLGRATALLHLGSVREAQGAITEALALTSEALRLRQSEHYELGVPQAYLQTGYLYYHQNLPLDARRAFSKALEGSRKVKDSQGISAALNGLALADVSLKQLNRAEREAKQSVQLAESIRSGIAPVAWRQLYFSTIQDYFRTYADILMQRYYRSGSRALAKRALAISERSRAREMFEGASEFRVRTLDNNKDRLAEREIAEQRLATRIEQRMRLLFDGQTAGVHEIESDITRLTSALRASDTKPSKTKTEHAVPAWSENRFPQSIQQNLDDQTTVLEFLLGPQHSYVWVLTRKTLTSFRLAARGDIEKAAYTFLTTFTGSDLPESPIFRDTCPINQSQNSSNAGRNLAGLLLTPLRHSLDKFRLVIVADELLNYVPFAAIPSFRAFRSTQESVNAYVEAEPEPLIVNHEIVNIPSASAWLVIRQRISPVTKPTGVMVLADPVFTCQGSRFANVIPKRETPCVLKDPPNHASIRGPDRLLFTGIEAERIKAIVPKGHLVSLTGFRANLKSVLQPQKGVVRFLHFATHGLLSDRVPQISGVLLSLFDEKGNPTDGMLNVWQISALQLKADCVFLNGCSTARGDWIDGEGLTGVANAFIRNGSRNVIASLWSINDGSGPMLAKEFYRAVYENNLGAPAALRQAQLSMMHDPEWKSSRDWAPFIVQGDWQ